MAPRPKLPSAGRSLIPQGLNESVWVLRTGRPLPASVTDEVLERTRRRRDCDNMSILGGGLRDDSWTSKSDNILTS